ncbi:MAG: cation:proton antiporter, partial [Candidatus Omnitrophica bacterium]|nr:cation:proton antiporter [Candidatus Omnitrophota bacterium]
ANTDQRLIFALFMATAMTISAMPITARALHDLKLSKTDLSFLIMSALSVNDIISWLLFTLVLGFFTQSTLDIFKVFVIIATTVGFTVICLTVGRKFSEKIILKIKEKQLPQTGVSLTFICLLGLLSGAITQKIGIHALFGFFLAGIMAGGAKSLSERTRQTISQMVHAIFVPLFFVGIGLKIDFLSNFDLFLVSLISVIGIIGRFLGAWFGVNLTKISKVNRTAIAVAHTPGGAMEVVVAMLALEYHLITEPVFVAIVFGAVISSVILGPWLNHSIRKRKEISILEFFSHRSIIGEIKTNNRDKAIHKLCELIAEQESLETDILYEAVIKRENAMGTALEEGVAIPHARLAFLKRPIIAFGRSLSGIDWDSPDGNLTNLIFLILTPEGEDDIQVQILALIAKAMSIKENRDQIMQAKDTEIWHILQKSFTLERIKRKNKTINKR